MITYAVGGAEQPPEKWQDADHPHKTLSAISVFDSECAAVHISEKNEVAFRPFGLDIPDELAAACQAVKEALTATQKQLEKNRNPVFAKPTWKETTTVGKALAALKHDSDLQKLKTLATLSEQETSRLRSLKEDLSKDPAKAAAEQTLKADNIRHLLDSLKGMATVTTDGALSSVFAEALDARVKRDTAQVASEKAFSHEPLSGVGGAVWRTLWESARRYSTEVAYPGQAFPPSKGDQLCVLCQQPLEAEATARMGRFEAFISEDTERLAQAAEQAAKKSRENLGSVSISTRLLKANLQAVAIQSPDLAKQARRFIAAARLRRYALLKALESPRQPMLPIMTENPSAPLKGLEDSARNYATELLKSAKGDERKRLETELAELSDRERLHQLMPVVEEEIVRLKDINFLEQCLTDTTTNMITKLGNDIADSVITPKLRDRFQEEIVKLAADKVRVEIVRSGGKYGSPQYQVRLFAKPEAKLKDILSEGERTCVALAAFLTEVATASHRSAFVFDDPVSSLDHRWRKQVAKRLVEEGASRQIVVFTHDLVFVNDLYDLADQAKRPIQMLTVSRGPSGAGVVTEGLPWKAKSVEDRIDKLEKEAREAQLLYESDDEEAYGNAAAKIYDNLRASWERGLEDVALFRVVQRHRDYINTKELKKITVLDDADCDAFHAGFQKCCDVVDAHDPSKARNADPPPPSEIMEDIQALKEWVESIRARQKVIK